MEHSTSIRRLAKAGILLSLLSSAAPAYAQSSWDPTLLVNTESFQTIDDGDGTTDVELQFGSSANELFYDVDKDAFGLTKGLDVDGDLSATGDITGSGSLGVDADISLNKDNGAVDAVINFGNDLGAETVRFSNTTNRFEFSTGAIINGNMQSTSATVTNLLNCNTIDTDAAGNLICGADEGGFTQQQMDDRYVNTEGDTMTGALTISDGFGLTASGDILTEGGLTLNKDNAAQDAVLTFGNDLGTETLRFSDTTNEFILSDDLEVQGQLSGASLSVAGGNVTIANDGTTVFNENGNPVDFRIEGDTNTNLFFLDASTDRIGIGTGTPETALDVAGTISGAALDINGNAIIDGTLTLNNVTYTFPFSDGAASGYVLATDGNGNLSWTSAGDQLGTTTGDSLFLAPEYPHAIYFGSGSATTGQLTQLRDVTTRDNYYSWTSSRAAIQNYWVSTRIKVPENFVSWTSTPIEFRYRTGVASAANNHLTMRFFDTAGTEIALTGASGLANTSFTTASVTGPEATGTYTPGSYITVYVKLAANNTASAAAHAGFIELNWNTSFN